jgi:hypothetical protein
MKVVIVLPPTALLTLGVAATVLNVGERALNAAGDLVNIVTGSPSRSSPGSWSVFIDMQANAIDIEMRRNLVEHPIPGREGGILQDMGSACTKLTLSGKWIYENEPDNELLKVLLPIVSKNLSWNWLRLQTMYMIYRLRQPLFIASDLITSAVMIDTMNYNQIGGQPNVYNYRISLKEFNPALTLAGIAGTGILATGLIPLVDTEVGR